MSEFQLDVEKLLNNYIYRDGSEPAHIIADRFIRELETAAKVSYGGWVREALVEIIRRERAYEIEEQP